jgi:hypothetical protein
LESSRFAGKVARQKPEINGYHVASAQKYDFSSDGLHADYAIRTPGM